jgi:hypothetical protein
MAAAGTDVMHSMPSAGGLADPAEAIARATTALPVGFAGG